MKTWLTKVWAGIKKLWTRGKKAWPWLKWVVIAVALALGYCRLRSKLSSVGTPKRGARWSRIAGVDTHIVIQDPQTGKSEMVELPPGVKAHKVRSAGIGQRGGYKIETLHTPVDRTGHVGESGLDL